MRRLTLALLSGAPLAAWASDFTGFLSVMYLIIVVSLFTTINLGLIIAFHSKGRYADRSFVNRHIGLGVIVPLIGCYLSVSDYRNEHDLFMTLGFNGLALLLVFIPLLLHKGVVQFHDISGKKLLTLSAVLLSASLYLAPLSILAIFASHAALKRLTGRWRNVGKAVFVGGCLFVAYWVFGTAYLFTILPE